jgi:hypothetical protein
VSKHFARWAPSVAGALLSAGAWSQSTDGGGAALERFLSEQRITTWLRLDYFHGSNSLDDEHNLLGGTLQIKALPRLSELLDGKVEARLTAPDVRDRKGYGPQDRLLEGFATLHLEHVDLRVGKQIVAWGRADGINPTDNLTPRDYLVLLPQEEDQRVGTLAVRLDAYLARALSLEVFASPFFEPDQFPLPTAGAVVATQQPRHSASNSEVGVRLNKVSGEFDWSLSYYHGYNLLPSASAAASSFRLYYDHIDVAGADCARNFGRLGFRSEVAYTWPTDHEGVDPNSRQRRLFWVNGMDRTFFENLNVNVQLFVRIMPRYEAPAELPDSMGRSAGAVNAIIGGQEASVSPGLTFRVSNQWLNNALRAEVLSLANFRRGDHYLRPLLTYDVSDRMQALLGANLWGGPPATQYGILKPDSGLFMEMRYAL